MTQLFRLSDGSEIGLPLECDEALVCFAVFRAKVASLPELPSGLKPLAFAGRTACVLMAADYRSMSIGPYREMVAMSPVRYAGKSKPRAGTGVFVHEIAVTAETARLAGIDVWGFPKYMAEIRMEEGKGKITASMESPRSAFELTISSRGLPIPAGAPLPVFTVREKKLLLSYIKMKGTMIIAPPLSARLSLKGKDSTLAFLGKSARAGIAGFMKVSRATLAEAVFEESMPA